MLSDTSRRSFLAAAVAAGETINGLPARKLGKTGLTVTTLGCGCAWTADPSVFTRAFDAGINHFDTAPVYQGGHSEAMVRAGLGANRAQVVLSTKTEASSKGDALQQLESSLKQLGTDRVDIWYLHGKSSPGGISADLVEALETAKQQGKTRFIGISTHRLPAVADTVLSSGKMDVVLTVHNFAMEQEVEQAAERLQRAGIGMVMMKALAGGRSPAAQAQGPRVVSKPAAIAAALRWAFARPTFASVLVGMISHDEVEDALAQVRAPFTDADRKTLAARLREIGPLYCRMCGSCEGACPRGLPVPDVLRFVMYAEGYGQFGAAREHFLALPQAARAVRCRECAECAVTCPNGVRVKERLERAQNWLA